MAGRPTVQAAARGRNGARAGGYTVVEAGIALAVIGLLLGMSLVPLGARIRAERADEVRGQLADISRAIVGYATTHRSPGAVAYLDSNPGVRAPIPANRPYLPCPDINGDGLEDRHALPSADVGPDGGFTGPATRNVGVIDGMNLLVRSYVGGSLDSTQRTYELEMPGDVTPHFYYTHGVRPGAGMTPNPLSHLTNLQLLYSVAEFIPMSVAISDDRSDNELITRGGCATDKGMLPWSTLGTHAHDPWGNRFTYRVDPVFASQVLGIGPETRSDMFDPRFPLVGEDLDLVAGGRTVETREFASYQRRLHDTASGSNITYAWQAGVEITINGEVVRPIVDDYPGLVCTSAYESQNIGCSMTANPAVITLVGRTINDVAETDLTLFDVLEGLTVARVYEQHEVVNGMAFVVVSHGPNGVGAVPHQGGGNYASPLGGGVNCSANLPPGIIDWPSTHPENENNDYPPNSFCGGSSSTDLHPRMNIRRSFPHSHSFISMPAHDTDSSVFDDELVHMSGEQLMNELRALGVVPGQAWVPPGTCDAC